MNANYLSIFAPCFGKNNGGEHGKTNTERTLNKLQI